MKQKMYQQFVYKIESSRILGAKKKDLQITPIEGRRNGELIALADSNVLRAIDEINGVDRNELMQKIGSMQTEIRGLRNSEENRAKNRKRIKELYGELDKLQLKTDYLMVTMNRPSDFDKINEGFKINGVGYKRLIGTPNGVKKSTVVYCPIVNERGIEMHRLLDERLNGGRDLEKEIVPAKFEAYKALACSASVELSAPKDILVVDDFTIKFEDDFIQLENSDGSDEPVMSEQHGVVELNASDGFGLICPELAQRWSGELGLDYTAGGMCIRNLFCKGMVYTFDFHEFAKRYYSSDTISDIWGNEHNVSDIEIILPVSVLKLWDSYKSLSHYLEMCDKYRYGFSATKVCEKELENERVLNYQFIQSYDLTDDEIKALVKPTIDEIKEIVCGDADKTLLFLRGGCGKNYDFNADKNNIAKALMIEPAVAKDPHIVTMVYNMLKKRIDDLKIGVAKVHGNYTVISGDPFAFCQNIFKCNVPDSDKGLLKAGEIYSEYWADKSGNEKQVVCFRAPMSVHNNVRKMRVAYSDEIAYWFKYMNAVNIINCHDTFYAAQNGADNDGDAILTTDNEILLRNTKELPAIMCVQKKADKHVITEELLEKANKNSFGDEIGAITNRITSMYDVITRFEAGSPQYESLQYRIKCGQLLQQDCIDKAKGIISKPMPKEWYDIHSVVIKDDDDESTVERKNYNREIIADKKPYFMIYVYPQLKKEYRKYVDAVSRHCKSAFGKSLDDLETEYDSLDEVQKEFLDKFKKYLPVSNENGVMNRLCRYVESEFEGYLHTVKFKDYRFGDILTSDKYENLRTTSDEMKKIKKLYEEFRSRMEDISYIARTERIDRDEMQMKKMMFDEQFARECLEICSSDRRLCDILLKVCYTNDKSKRFVWATFGDMIVKNLLKKYNAYSYFIRYKNGEYIYGGNRYKKICVKEGNENADCDERTAVY